MEKIFSCCGMICSDREYYPTDCQGGAGRLKERCSGWNTQEKTAVKFESLETYN